MYLHGAATHGTSLSGGWSNHKNDNFLSRTVGREVRTIALSRAEFKEVESAKLDIKGDKANDAAHKVDIKFLRKQIAQFPEGLKEDARKRFVLSQNNKRKDLQDFQMVTVSIDRSSISSFHVTYTLPDIESLFQQIPLWPWYTQQIMMTKFEEILRTQLSEKGLNYRKFKIGWYDKGTYEKFFKIGPGRYMTKAQYVTALRLSFGDSISRSAKETSKLYDSFDPNRTDEMDWRSFLFLFTIMMQPFNSFTTHLRWGFAIYSSIGSLDMECEECLALGMIKDMLCTPVLLSMRSEVIIFGS